MRDPEQCVPDLIPFAVLPPHALLRREDLQQLWGCSADTLARAVRLGDLPQPWEFNRRQYWTIPALITHITQQIEAATKAYQHDTKRITSIRRPT